MNTSVLLNLQFFTVSSVYALLNWFLLLIVNWLIMKTDLIAYSVLQRQLKVEKNFSFIAAEDQSLDLILDSHMHYLLF